MLSLTFSIKPVTELKPEVTKQNTSIKLSEVHTGISKEYINTQVHDEFDKRLPNSLLDFVKQVCCSSIAYVTTNLDSRNY